MRLIALAAALLAGCAMSPQEVRDTGIRESFMSAARPLPAASCIVANIEAMHYGMGIRYTVQLRPLALPEGAYEVIAYGNPEVHGALAVATVAPATTGSAIVVIRSGAGPIGVDRLASMADGC